ncbi:Hypothetical protein CINCED_3A013690 [Cinara cedri]|uniref:Uncharacterized protein n=1 Tax=Cinara cedri TaxID=506608 RepID=A0A5E4MQP2_9HEMI|nr:Hypothetical protein CINCED_3A013690 [Cinara cedri]
MPITSLIAIGQGATSTSATSLCHLDAMELFLNISRPARPLFSYKFLGRGIRTSYDELPITSLIAIGQGATSTSATSLCHLDAMELFLVLKNSGCISNTSSTDSSFSSVNTTTKSTSHTPVTRQTKLAPAPGSNDVRISESIDATQAHGHVTKEMYVDGADAGLCGEIRNISVGGYLRKKKKKASTRSGADVNGI